MSSIETAEVAMRRAARRAFRAQVRHQIPVIAQEEMLKRLGLPERFAQVDQNKATLKDLKAMLRRVIKTKHRNSWLYDSNHHLLVLVAIGATLRQLEQTDCAHGASVAESGEYGSAAPIE